MINRLDLNRDNLVPQSKDKKIEEIGIADLKLSMQEIAMAEVIDFTCKFEKKGKLLKHRWSISDEVGKVYNLGMV